MFAGKASAYLSEAAFNIHFYLETSGGQSSKLYLKVVHS
jgi:hypothetical protein